MVPRQRPGTVSRTLPDELSEFVRVDHASQEILDLFLLAGTRLRVDVVLERKGCDLVEGVFPFEYRGGLGLLPVGVAVGQNLVVPAVLNQLGRGEECAGAEICSANVSMDQILRE